MKRFRRHAGLWVWCYAMLFPVLAIYAYVRIYPIGRSVQLSFFDWKLMARVRPFIGWDNYTRMLGDENFHIAIWNTFVYSLATVLLSTVIALPLAVLLARRGRASAIYQTIYFLPVITPLVPMSIAWKWIYDYNYGILNYALSVRRHSADRLADRPAYRIVGAGDHGCLESARLQSGDLPRRHPQHSSALH